MSDYGIKPEWRLAFQDDEIIWSKDAEAYISDLRDLSVHLLAGWMRERFKREHAKAIKRLAIPNCQICGEILDPRHAYTADDWLQAARKELGK